jgi:hypothetical protein
MAKKKYSKYVMKHGIETGSSGLPKIQIIGERDFKSDFTIMCLVVTKPILMETYPHSHVFDMYLTFIGMDPNGLNELGAEIELGLGEEREMHVITTPTSVYIPKGMVHCPLNFKRIDKPVLLIHSTIASKYEKNAIYK